MGGNICRHSHCNSGSSVYQKIGISGGKYRGLFLRLVKVRHKFNGVLIDIRQHFHRNFAKSCLCVPHGCGTVTVYRTKISMAVYQWITGGPFLCHINQCTINRTVTVGMIFTHGITYDTCTFSMWFIRSVIQFDHGK